MQHPGGSGAVRPLLRDDPPTIGEVVLTGRLRVTDAGIVYAGTLGGRRVAVALLSAGAETDSFARARFVDAVEECRRAGAGWSMLAAGDEPDIAPWVAVSAESWDGAVSAAAALLAPVTLASSASSASSSSASSGAVRGPGFLPHWAERQGPGRWRAWPLPWPSAFSLAGRWTYVASFALVVAIASIALLIAVRLFENQPPAPVGPPFPLPTNPPPTSEPTPTPTPTSPSPTPSTGAPRTTLKTIPPIV